MQIGGDDDLFVGEDKVLVLENIVDRNGALVNFTSWTIIFDVRKTDKAPDPAIFSKTATITGTYNVDPLVNTLKASVTLTDDELNTVTNKTYRHSWKRDQSGFETILAFGDFVVQKATAP